MLKRFSNDEEKKNQGRKGIKTIGCLALAGALVLGGVSFHGFVDARADETGRVTLLRASNEEVVEEKDDETRTKGYLDVVDIVEETMPTVVSISTKSVQEVMDYYSMFGFYGYAPSVQEYEVEGGGSGIIVGRSDTELLVLTNYHVVEGANQLAVCFIDNNAYKGVVKGTDPEMDLAVIAVKLDDMKEDTLKEIKVAKIGSSDELKVGEQVVLIGNAMGYGQSVTTGIVSAKNRKIDDDGKLTDEGANLIQTDAAINPGNSGGAMMNMDGEVVGINSSKLSSTAVEGMCYAIAISDVEDSLEEMMNAETREKVSGTHGALGIAASTVEDREQQLYGIPAGAYVAEVNEGSAAADAGIPEGSIITEFEGRKVKGVEELIEMLSYYEPGETVEVVASVKGDNGYEEQTFTVVLEKAKSDDEEPEEEATGGRRGFSFGDWEEGDEDYFFRGWGEDEDEEEEEDDDIFGQGTFGSYSN